MTNYSSDLPFDIPTSEVQLAVSIITVPAGEPSATYLTIVDNDGDTDSVELVISMPYV